MRTILFRFVSIIILIMIRWQKVGFVFQFFNLLQNLTALENVETAMMFAGLRMQYHSRK